MGLLDELDALNRRSFSSASRSAAASKGGSRAKAAGAAPSKKPTAKASKASPKSKATSGAFAIAEVSPAAGKGKAKAIVVDDESSEVEPEAAIIVDAAPRSSTPAKRKAKASGDEAPPNYSEWTLEDLQSEARRFGFKSSRSRRIVISQLQAVWEALHPVDRRARLSGSPSPFDDLRYGCGAGAADLSSTQPSFGVLSSDADIGDLTMQLAREGGSATSGSTGTRSRSSSSAPSTADTDPDGEDLDEGADAEADAALEADPDNSVLDVPSALSTQIAEAVREDAQLWHRILLMEPISFDEIASVVRSRGVTGIRNKEVLRSWLDRQGICVYFGELTGSRTRY